MMSLLADWLSQRGFQVGRYPHGLTINWWGTLTKKPVALIRDKDDIVIRSHDGFTKELLKDGAPTILRISGLRYNISEEFLSDPAVDIEEFFKQIVKAATNNGGKKHEST